MFKDHCKVIIIHVYIQDLPDDLGEWLGKQRGMAGIPHRYKKQQDDFDPKKYPVLVSKGADDSSMGINHVPVVSISEADGSHVERVSHGRVYIGPKSIEVFASNGNDGFVRVASYPAETGDDVREHLSSLLSKLEGKELLATLDFDLCMIKELYSQDKMIVFDMNGEGENKGIDEEVEKWREGGPIPDRIGYASAEKLLGISHAMLYSTYKGARDRERGGFDTEKLLTLYIDKPPKTQDTGISTDVAREYLNRIKGVPNGPPEEVPDWREGGPIPRVMYVKEASELLGKDYPVMTSHQNFMHLRRKIDGVDHYVVDVEEVLRTYIEKPIENGITVEKAKEYLTMLMPEGSLTGKEPAPRGVEVPEGEPVPRVMRTNDASRLIGFNYNIVNANLELKGLRFKLESHGPYLVNTRDVLRAHIANPIEGGIPTEKAEEYLTRLGHDWSLIESIPRVMKTKDFSRLLSKHYDVISTSTKFSGLRFRQLRNKGLFVDTQAALEVYIKKPVDGGISREDAMVLRDRVEDEEPPDGFGTE